MRAVSFILLLFSAFSLQRVKNNAPCTAGNGNTTADSTITFRLLLRVGDPGLIKHCLPGNDFFVATSAMRTAMPLASDRP